MTAWNVTLPGKAATQFTNYDFDSLCNGVDGQLYGIKSDGLYLLTGSTDNGSIIEASVDFGSLNMGDSRLKRGYVAYLGGRSDTKLLMGVNGYEYASRSFGATETVQRFDIGKGIRSNYFEVTLRNQNGADFEVDSLEFKPSGTGRRI